MPGADRGRSAEDHKWLRAAIELSRRCLPSDSAFSVGAVIVSADSNQIASGFSRETGLHDHAEEIALHKVAAGDARLQAATIYSSLEPCSVRKSRPLSCTRLILQAGIRRVVFAWREPLLFADCHGAELLSAAGAEVVEVTDLATLAREANSHLPGLAGAAG